MEINEKIKALRIDADKTQAEIAEILGTSYQYYQKYEKGKYPIPTNHLKTICEYYKVSANYLLDIPETYDRTKEEIIERQKNIKERIKTKTVIDIILWGEEQGHIIGDTSLLIKTIKRESEAES